MSKVIAQKLDSILGVVGGKIFGVYWPMRGEPDLISWMAKIIDNGATVGLPTVVRKNHPVEFHKWVPGAKMKPGHWRIPVPAEEECVNPEVVIVPLLGVDKNNYRLGYGGGFYDRTLALVPAETKIIGVGQKFAEIETIYPMEWDIPMQEVVLA